MFFYSILAITIVFFASAFLNPSPLNFLSGIALFPLLIYFWLKMTSASKVSSGKWSLRFILILTLLSALGIYAFSLNQRIVSTKKVKEEQAKLDSSTNQKIEELAKEIKILQEKDVDSKELSDLKEELAKICPKESFSDLLLETTPSASPTTKP